MSDPSQPPAPAVAAPAVGSRAAFEALVDDHLDHVHDHVARWSRDGRLAADAVVAAFAAVLGADEQQDRAVLLRRARAEVVAAVPTATDATADGTALGDAALGAVRAPATGPPSGTHGLPDSADAEPVTPAGGAEAWATAAGLDDHEFSALDLAVRQRLAPEEVATVLGVPTDTAHTLVRRSTRRLALHDLLGAYGALAVVRAPAGVRARLTAFADERFGSPAPATRPGFVLGAALLLLLAVGGVATALRVDTPPETGPPSVVAAPVPEPTEDPTSAPTLSPLPSASEDTSQPPTPSPSPTVAPSPSASPTVLAVELALTLTAPTAGTRLDVAAGDTQTGTVAVAASVTTVGGDAPPDGTQVVWTSDLDPGRVLLTGTTGEVVLGAPAPCGETVHPLRATATEPTSGSSATAVVDVLVVADCPLTVTITVPTSPAVVQATGAGVRRTAVLDVAATADGEVTSWSWTSDRVTGVLLGAASGRIEFTVEGCEQVQHVLTATATATDGSTATDTVLVTVEPACTP